MSIPWLKNQQDAGSPSSDVKMRKPDDPADSYDPMHAAAEDLIAAIHSKDIKGVAEALRAAQDLSHPMDEEAP